MCELMAGDHDPNIGIVCKPLIKKAQSGSKPRGGITNNLDKNDDLLMTSIVILP